MEKKTSEISNKLIMYSKNQDVEANLGYTVSFRSVRAKLARLYLKYPKDLEKQ